jgi:hypothetical protein
MPPRRSVSFPLYFEASGTGARDAVRLRRLARLALGAWAVATYVIYWLVQVRLQ